MRGASGAFALTLLASGCTGANLPARDGALSRWCVSAFERTTGQAATDTMLADFAPDAVSATRDELAASGRQPSTVEIVRTICRRQNLAVSQ